MRQYEFIWNFNLKKIFSLQCFTIFTSIPFNFYFKRFIIIICISWIFIVCSYYIKVYYLSVNLFGIFRSITSFNSKSVNRKRWCIKWNFRFRCNYSTRIFIRNTWFTYVNYLNIFSSYFCKFFFYLVIGYSHSNWFYRLIFFTLIIKYFNIIGCHYSLILR